MSHGLICWNHENCESESPVGESAEDTDLRAMVAGWKMGLTSDGQAHYSCPRCAPLLYNVQEHQPDGWSKAGRFPSVYKRRRVSGHTQLLHELWTGAWEHQPAMEPQHG